MKFYHLLDKTIQIYFYVSTNSNFIFQSQFCTKCYLYSHIYHQWLNQYKFIDILINSISSFSPKFAQNSTYTIFNLPVRISVENFFLEKFVDYKLALNYRVKKTKRRIIY